MKFGDVEFGDVEFGDGMWGGIRSVCSGLAPRISLTWWGIFYKNTFGWGSSKKGGNYAVYQGTLILVFSGKMRKTRFKASNNKDFLLKQMAQKRRMPFS